MSRQVAQRQERFQKAIVLPFHILCQDNQAFQGLIDVEQ